MDKDIRTNRARISVILPVYNGEKTLKAAITSVLKQSQSNFELIIINDGSSDNSDSIINSFTDKRIVVIDQDNMGLQKALNRGLSMARGEYISRIDADDEWIDDDKLRRQYEFLDVNRDYVLVGTGAIIVDVESGRKVRVLPPTEDNGIRATMLSTNNFFHSSVMFRKETALRAGRYSEDAKWRHIEDYVLWLEMGRLGKLKNLPRLSLKYSFNPDSISSKNRREQLRKGILLMDKYREFYPAYRRALLRNYSRLILYGYLGLFNLRNVFFRFKNHRDLIDLETESDDAGIRAKPRIVIWESLSNVSGGQMVLLNMLPSLKEKFAITVVLPRPGEFSSALEKLNVNFRFMPIGSYNIVHKGIVDIVRYILAVPRNFLVGLDISDGASLIYANSTRVLPIAWAVGCFKNIPLVWHNHSRTADINSRALINMIGKRRTVKKIIAVSNAIKRDLPELAYKTTTIYNGVDLNRFSFTTKARSSRIKIGIIGDLIPTKGQDLAIKALANSDLNYELNLIGSPRTGYDGYKKYLENLIMANHREKDVLFLGRRTDIPELISNMDLILLPSTVFEACPLAALESLACGRPVIAAGLGGLREIIIEGYNGYLFIANSWSDLQAKIKIFSGLSRTNLIRQQKNCRQSAIDNYDLRKETSEVGNLIDNILENSRS